jgi:putative acetyltransferase
MTNPARKVEDQPIIRPVVNADAQDLFGLLSLCYGEYPGASSIRTTICRT